MDEGAQRNVAEPETPYQEAGEEVPVNMKAKGPIKSDGRKPKPPPMGPGMAPREGENPYGRVQVDERFEDVEDPLKEIADDEAVDAGGFFQDSKIEQILAKLDRELVALKEVKRRVREVASLLVVDRLRRSMALEAGAPTLHMCFTGNPGTGKTTVAQRMGEILFKLGYVRKGHVVSVTREDLVGQYVGHTAPKTAEVLKRAMGGVLFIDEAYHIYRVDNERDYGQETVEMLLQVMENQREDIVVIMAGYKDHMDRFFHDVPGLSSRIAHHIDFPDYEIDELMDIARLISREQHYEFDDDAEKAFEEYLRVRMNQPRFANGRSVRNALDRVRMRHAIRLYESAKDGGKLTKKDLVTIHAEDILGSRVFDGGAYAKKSDEEKSEEFAHLG